MSKKLLIIISTMVLFISSSTQVLASDQTDKFDKINDYLEGALETANIPGASMVIVDKDKVLFQNTYGNCKSLNDSFIIGSMSKSFTAMAIMKLAEQGKVELDNPISEYLPEAPNGNQITVKQLLNQTSGISKYARQDNFEITSKQGTYVYANANYGLLGQIVEKVSGCSYKDYINNNIFIPTGMKQSYASLNAAGNGLIDGYRNYFGFTIKERLPYPEAGSKGWLSVSCGYLISNAPDMGRYLQVYLNGGKGIISPESVHSMFYDNADVMPDIYYGMGWGLFNNYSEPILEHGGLVENYSSDMILLPESGIGVVILANTNDYLVANKIMYTTFESIKKMLLGEEPTQIDSSSYWNKHLLIDFIYLLIVILCLLPLLRIKKRKKCLQKSKRLKYLISFTGIHIVIPSVILLLPVILGIPIDVVKRFVPDLFLVLLIGIVLSYGTGLYKIFLIIKNKQYSNKQKDC